MNRRWIHRFAVSLVVVGLSGCGGWRSNCCGVGINAYDHVEIEAEAYITFDASVIGGGEDQPHRVWIDLHIRNKSNKPLFLQPLYAWVRTIEEVGGYPSYIRSFEYRGGHLEPKETIAMHIESHESLYSNYYGETDLVEVREDGHYVKFVPEMYALPGTRVEIELTLRDREGHFHEITFLSIVRGSVEGAAEEDREGE